MFGYPAPIHELFFELTGLGPVVGTAFLALIVLVILCGTWVLVEADSEPS